MCRSRLSPATSSAGHAVLQNSAPTELTAYGLGEFVKAVYVDAPDKSCSRRRQKAYIYSDLVGCVPVDEPPKAEQA